MVRRVSSPQKKKKKYRRRYLRRITSPVILRNYGRFNPPVPPERSDSTFSYDFIDEFDMIPQRHTTDDFVEISPPMNMRPVYAEERPVYVEELPINPRTFSERRYQEATDRVLRLQKEEEEMIRREAFSIYPERGETAKFLRKRYIKEREREIRDEEEEEFRRSERKRRLIEENYRRKKREESLRRMAESRRRTSPIFRSDKPSQKPGIISKLKGFISKKSPKKGSAKKGSAKKGSAKKGSGRKGSSKKKPPKPEKPTKEKVEAAIERSSSRRTSPVKRSNPKKKRKAREVKIKEWGEK